MHIGNSRTRQLHYPSIKLVAILCYPLHAVFDRALAVAQCRHCTPSGTTPRLNSGQHTMLADQGRMVASFRNFSADVTDATESVVTTAQNLIAMSVTTVPVVMHKREYFPPGRNGLADA